ncbi:hypothetical protein QJS66_11340 [Kocuria rhizophila]|nr:hypothetical protein QJS66_11340 [Kocuria rhizophila]
MVLTGPGPGRPLLDEACDARCWAEDVRAVRDRRAAGARCTVSRLRRGGALAGRGRGPRLGPADPARPRVREAVCATRSALRRMAGADLPPARHGRERSCWTCS